uniref:Molybdopterin biosynthesis protein n=1 Tax=Leptosiphonia brodiei TaxID=2608611 RepID=A0A1Z1MAK7_9FLOR|nr:Molybdopterin biosynthesis protein [Leptosiphonia brodiei]ARW62989.1 Molybdopterin biosynthesis protein [Leptosiphonia brodiei]
MKNQLSREEIILYKQQINLENVGLEGQNKIRKTKILVIGAGGLGCPILIYLVSSGIGYVGIVDNDKIESSNLNRQILYKMKDIKLKKVLAAKKNLNLINQQCQIIVHNYVLNEYNSIEIISYYDIILDATDNFIARCNIDEACYKLHKIYVYGAANKFSGQSGVFNYQNGIRYRNIYELKFSVVENQCDIEGIMGITTGYVGILQATEAIKIVLGLNKTSKDYINIYQLINAITKRKEIKPQRHQMNNIKLRNMIQDNQNFPLIYKNLIDEEKKIIIDLKNEKEFIDEHIKKAINIPIMKFKQEQTINLLKKYEKINNIIIYCKNTQKTNIASQLLKQKIIKHKILKSNNKNLVK